MKNYKTIFGILASAVLVALVSSCNLNKYPVFDDDDAFAAFDNSSYAVAETVGTLSIPVTVASLNGLSTTVTYKAIDGSATAGVNYEVVDENGNEDNSGVLTFSNGERTKYINVKITDINDDNFEKYGYESSFTGALSFSLNLESGGSVNLGLESTCTVTINDMNHPLADLIGNYKISGESGRYGDTTWDANLYGDEENFDIIWVHGLDPYMVGLIDDVYFSVSEDMETLTLSIPAWAGSYGGDYICYIFLSADGYYYPDSSGTIDFTYDSETGSFVSDEDWGFMVGAYSEPSFDEDYFEGYYEYVWPPITLTKVD